MKIAKVKITKNRKADDSETTFEYPSNYDAKVIKPFMYQNEGQGTEFCLAHVPDNFEFTNDIKEVNAKAAEGLVTAWVNKDKDINDEKMEKEGVTRKDIIAKKINHINA